jgi:hypothetical protein
MRKTLRFLQLSALSSFLLAACGTQDEFDLATLPLTSEDDKSDAAGKSPLTWARPSAFNVVCIRHPCASNLLLDVNTAASHLVYAYDWRALKLSGSDEKLADAQAKNMLLRGRYASVKVAGEMVEVYQVTRANMRVADVADSPETDRYYSTKAASTGCPQAPCSGLAATRLNLPSPQPEPWTGVDLSKLGLSQKGVATLQDELAAGTAYVSTSGQAKDGIVPVGQAFRPLKSGPLQ